MADLIIKPTSGGSLKLQEDGGTDAISVGTDGQSTITQIHSASKFPTGHIIQVQSLTLSSAQEKTSPTANTWFDIPSFTLNITPSATSSKVMVMVVMSIGQDESEEVGMRLMRGSTAIGIGDAAGNRTRVSTSARMDAGSSSDYRTLQRMIHHLDSPSTTSATTYKVQWRAMYGTDHLYLNRDYQWNDDDDRSASISTITLMEVAG